MTHASRNTNTGIVFEQEAKNLCKCGVDISKTKFCKFFADKNIDVLDYLSWKFQPDEAYFIPNTNEIIIYEKKTQNTSGSADEKLGACGWKVSEYKALCNAAGISHISYIYCFSDWFKQDRYKKLLKYIRNVDDCDYFFWESA